MNGRDPIRARRSSHHHRVIARSRASATWRSRGARALERRLPPPARHSAVSPRSRRWIGHGLLAPFGAATPVADPLHCSPRPAAAELTHQLRSINRALRVQTVPMAPPVRFDILADYPGLGEQRRAPPDGLKRRAQSSGWCGPAARVRRVAWVRAAAASGSSRKGR
jgi:hypothetical protein